MAGANFEDFINFKRFSNHFAMLPMVIYFPFGVFLGVLRLFIFLHAALLFFVLPNKFPLKRMILRVMLTVAGIPISVHGVPKVDNKKLIVANGVSSLDPFILALLCNNKVVIDGPVVKRKNLLIPHFLLPNDENHDQVLVKLKENMNDSLEPLLFFPERIRTNGKMSLLKFSKLPFELDCPIQPVTIQTSRFLFDVSVSTFLSSAVEDILWCLVFPFTLFTVKYLPVTEKKPGESSVEFSSRVQSNMAKSLGINVSEHMHHDVIEYAKYRSIKYKEEMISSSPTEESSTPSNKKLPLEFTANIECEDEEINAMLKQVKDVFPDIHPQGIIEDLKKTRDVDMTITNILEGKVKSVPRKEVSSPQTAPPASNLSFKAKKFENSAASRHLSFSERKQAMLETARTKYKMKHGLM